VVSRADVRKLQQRIGYSFRNRMLLDEALTHASAAYGQKGLPDYQRLEFLGDRVLGMVLSEHLFREFPDAPEGKLARQFNELVNKRTCAEVAKEIGLGAHIRLGDSEARAGGRAKESILADCCEALLGAVYLDGGWEPAREQILRHWLPRVAETGKTVPVDAKTALQEWMQAKGKAAPRYVKVARSGPDHAPLFVYEARAEGLEPTRGEGSSRKSAEQEAASKMLIREGVWNGELHDGGR
jgi:ribonuclease-3